MPGQFESILDKLQAKLGKQTVRRASTINRPRPKREVQQIQIFNEFNRRNPRSRSQGGLGLSASQAQAVSAANAAAGMGGYGLKDGGLATMFTRRR